MLVLAQMIDTIRINKGSISYMESKETNKKEFINVADRLIFFSLLTVHYSLTATRKREGEGGRNEQRKLYFYIFDQSCTLRHFMINYIGTRKFSHNISVKPSSTKERKEGRKKNKKREIQNGDLTLSKK